MKIILNTLEKYMPYILLTFACIVLYNLISYRIYPYEFDTNVYFAILQNFISHGKILIPIVAREISSICNSELICSYSYPAFTGAQIYEQFPPDYTSGFLLIFFPALLSNIISFLLDINPSIKFFIQIYSIAGVVIYFICCILILNKLKPNKYESALLVSSSFLGYILLVQFAANGIVGELYSSIILSLVALTVYIGIYKKFSLGLYILCSALLGTALEAKISTVFVVGIIFLSIIIKCYISYKNKLYIIYNLVAICIPKLLIFGYIFYSLDFNINNIFNYIKSSIFVYSINANAGLNWGESSIYKQILGLLSNPALNTIIYIALFSYLASACMLLKIKSKKSLLEFTYVSLILISSLIYPLTFKFPYTRIYSAFICLTPLCFLLLFSMVSRAYKSKYNYEFFRWAPTGALSIISLYALSILPISIATFQPLKPTQFESVMDAYQTLNLPQDAIFLTPHFFSMPWDAYLSGALDHKSPLSSHNIYTEDSFGKQLNDRNSISGKPVLLLESCRWGHCNKSEKLIKIIKIPNSRESIEFICNLISPTINTYYKIYSCALK